MENFSRIYSSLEETIEELNHVIANPMEHESSAVKLETVKTKRLFEECKTRIWLLEKLLDGKITEQEFTKQLKEELNKLNL